ERFVKQIRTLATAGNESPKALAQANSTAVSMKVTGKPVTVWFTRTFKEVDMQDAIARIAKGPNGAKDGALFLMFQTGAKGSLLEAIMNRREDKNFYVHGVISSPPVEGGKKKAGPKLTPDEAVANRVAFVHHSERVRYAPDLL